MRIEDSCPVCGRPGDCCGDSDRYRKALEQIAGHFLPGDEQRTYAPATETLDMIRGEARQALAAPLVRKERSDG